MKRGHHVTNLQPEPVAPATVLSKDDEPANLTQSRWPRAAGFELKWALPLGAINDALQLPVQRGINRKGRGRSCHACVVTPKIVLYTYFPLTTLAPNIGRITTTQLLTNSAINLVHFLEDTSNCGRFPVF
jgi:hypothetical protein